ncbi:MAG: hypothetical protein ABR543_09475, partial [Gemmatimonadaceae bacterium]
IGLVGRLGPVVGDTVVLNRVEQVRMPGGEWNVSAASVASTRFAPDVGTVISERRFSIKRDHDSYRGNRRRPVCRNGGLTRLIRGWCSVTVVIRQPVGIALPSPPQQLLDLATSSRRCVYAT